MAYLLRNNCVKITGITKLLLKLSLEVGRYTFLQHGVACRNPLYNTSTGLRRRYCAWCPLCIPVGHQRISPDTDTCQCCCCWWRWWWCSDVDSDVTRCLSAGGYVTHGPCRRTHLRGASASAAIDVTNRRFLLLHASEDMNNTAEIPVNRIRVLGVLFTQDLALEKQVTSVSAKCFFQLRYCKFRFIIRNPRFLTRVCGYGRMVIWCYR